MRNKARTKAYSVDALGFKELGISYEEYLKVEKDAVELHFFLFKDLIPTENYGQVYIRTSKIAEVYQSLLDGAVPIHPNGKLESKSWGQKEFSLPDPNGNLLTFGQEIS